MTLSELLSLHTHVLAECAVAEPLSRQDGITLHPTLFNSPLIYGPDHATAALSAIYHDYLTAASEANIPLILTAPTWRLDATRVAEANMPESINADAVKYLTAVRDDSDSSAPVLVGALTGPQHDCYRPELAPATGEAEAFHTPQISALAQTNADFLMAQTLPSVAEALGIARAMAVTEKPYIISFCIGPDGNILDGTPLTAAMTLIDFHALLKRPPIGYFVNCTHPQFLLDAYPHGGLDRLIGIQANGSSRDVRSLDGAATTETDPIDQWTRAMLELHEKHTIPILGGCCGTSLPHLHALAHGMNAST